MNFFKIFKGVATIATILSIPVLASANNEDDDPPVETAVEHYHCTAAMGSIDLTETATGNYRYAWSNGATTQDIDHLLPGTYTVTVTFQPSGNGCIDLIASEIIVEDHSLFSFNCARRGGGRRRRRNKC